MDAVDESLWVFARQIDVGPILDDLGVGDVLEDQVEAVDIEEDKLIKSEGDFFVEDAAPESRGPVKIRYVDDDTRDFGTDHGLGAR